MNERRGFLAWMGAGLVTLFGAKPAQAYATPYKTGISELKPLVAKLESFGPRIRLWKLGSLEHKIWPTEKAYEKLGTILREWNGQDDLDVIWNDTLTLEVINSTDDTDIDIIELPDGKRRIVIRGDKTEIYEDKKEI